MYQKYYMLVMKKTENNGVFYVVSLVEFESWIMPVLTCGRSGNIC